MALHYFIDGYNLIRSSDRWLGLSTADQIRQLIQFIEENKITGSNRNSFTLVFDGHGVKQARFKSSFVRIIFSESLDADTYIKNKIDEMSNARNGVVVTNDKSIVRWVRGAGAQVLSCEEFLFQKKKETSHQRAGKPDPDTAQSINNELKKLWGLK
jgi:predicted RNA-binding protein with PIN domain